MDVGNKKVKQSEMTSTTTRNTSNTPSSAKANSLAQRGHSTKEHDKLQLWLFNKDNQKKIAAMFEELVKKEEPKDFVHKDRSWQWERDDYRCYDAFYEMHEHKILGQNNVEIVGKRTEFPIYNYGYSSKYLLGVVDCQLEFRWSWKRHIRTIRTVKHFPEHTEPYDHDGGRLSYALETYHDAPQERTAHDAYDNVYRYLDVLCEIKPKLDSIGGMLSQVKIYKENMRPIETETARIEYEKLQSDHRTSTYEQRDKAERWIKESRKIIPIYTVVLTNDQNTEYDDFLLEEGVRVYRVT